MHWIEKKRMKLLAGAFLALVVIGVISVSLVTSGNAPSPGRLSFLTSPTGSIVHTTGSTLASIISQKTDMTVLVSSVSGPQIGAPRVNQGQADFTLLNSADAFRAFRGMEPNYRSANRNLRLVAVGFRNDTGIIVRRDSDIHSPEDIRGRWVTGVFSAHKTCTQIGNAQLANLGLSENDVQIVPVTHARGGIEALADGRADVALCISIGQAIVQEVNAQHPLRFLSLDDSLAAIKRAQEHFPAGEIRTHEAGSSTGVIGEVNVWSYPFYLVTHKGTPDEIVYRVLQAISENIDDLRQTSNIFDRWDTNAMIRPDITLPVHEGAKRYFQDHGFWNANINAANELQLKAQER